MPIRILLADDNAMLRAAIRQFLAEAASDLEVVGEVGDGTATVQQALALAPDLVLMDVEMPSMDGGLATRALLSQLPSVKVLALSLHRQPALIQEMLDAGAGGYVSKDDAFEDLIPAIRAVVAGRSFLSPSLPPPYGSGADPDGDPDDQ